MFQFRTESMFEKVVAATFGRHIDSDGNYVFDIFLFLLIYFREQKILLNYGSIWQCFAFSLFFY